VAASQGRLGPRQAALHGDGADEHDGTVPTSPLGRRALGAAGALIVSVALVFVAQFALSGWSEENPLHHDFQHGLIFVAGLGVGAAATTLYVIGRRPVGGTD